MEEQDCPTAESKVGEAAFRYFIILPSVIYGNLPYGINRVRYGAVPYYSNTICERTLASKKPPIHASGMIESSPSVRADGN